MPAHILGVFPDALSGFRRDAAGTLGLFRLYSRRVIALTRTKKHVCHPGLTIACTCMQWVCAVCPFPRSLKKLIRARSLASLSLGCPVVGWRVGMLDIYSQFTCWASAPSCSSPCVR